MSSFIDSNNDVICASAFIPIRDDSRIRFRRIDSHC